MSEGSGSHCSMVSERPRLLNHFTLHVAPNATFAPFISATVDILNPNDFTYELNPSVAATSFMAKSSHYTIGNWMPRRLVRCSDAIHFVVLPFRRTMCTMAGMGCDSCFTLSIRIGSRRAEITASLFAPCQSPHKALGSSILGYSIWPLFASAINNLRRYGAATVLLTSGPQPLSLLRKQCLLR